MTNATNQVIDPRILEHNLEQVANEQKARERRMAMRKARVTKEENRRQKNKIKLQSIAAPIWLVLIIAGFITVGLYWSQLGILLTGL